MSATLSSTTPGVVVVVVVSRGGHAGLSIISMHQVHRLHTSAVELKFDSVAFSVLSLGGVYSADGSTSTHVSAHPGMVVLLHRASTVCRAAVAVCHLFSHFGHVITTGETVEEQIVRTG